MAVKPAQKPPAYSRAKQAPPVLVPIRRLVPCKKGSLVVVLKNPRNVDRQLLDMARGQPCLLQSHLCNHSPDTAEACHGAGVTRGKGMGYKVGDHQAVHGWSDCNHYTDAYMGATAEEMLAQFDAGHVRQIKVWTNLVNSERAAPRDKASA